MRAARVASKEQLRLIMECRSSGLTDYEWCLQNDIKPGTFYNWVKRLRQKGYTEIPDALHGHIRQKQEIVKIELPNSIPNESAVFCADEYCGQSYKDMMKHWYLTLLRKCYKTLQIYNRYGCRKNP